MGAYSQDIGTICAEFRQGVDELFKNGVLLFRKYFINGLRIAQYSHDMSSYDRNIGDYDWNMGHSRIF